MNLLPKSSFQFRRALVKYLNITLVVLLMLGPIPASVQGMQVQRQSGQCQIPQSGFSLFLPAVTTSASQLASSVINAVIGQQATERVLAYEVGKTYQYEYEVVVNTKSSKRDSSGVREDGSEKTVIYALAEVSITDKKQDGTFVGQVVFKDPFICNTDGTSESTVDDEVTLKALSTPLQFEQKPDGVIVSVSSPANAPAQSVNLQKGVLNALQLTLQAGNSYVAQEDAGQGKVNIQYAVEQKSDGLHITKTFNRNSFLALLAEGEDNKNLELTNKVEMVLDSSKKVISHVTYSERIASGNGNESDDGSSAEFDGVTAWSTAESSGSVKLKNVVATTAVLASELDVIYQADSMGGDIVKNNANSQGIDISTVDVDAKLKEMEASPTNPDLKAYILALVDADPTDPKLETSVVSQIGKRLAENASNIEVANAYIDLLGSIGTERAQELLAAVLGNPNSRASHLVLAPFSLQTRDQALINISMIISPTATTVSTVKGLVASSQVAASELSELNVTAVSVLGAVANNLLERDPEEAKELADFLTEKLEEQQSAETLSLYLDALGNAGHPDTLDTLKRYTSSTVQVADALGNTQVLTDAIEVQASALIALRKIPGDEPESLLLGTLSDSTESDVVRTIVANVLSVRGDLSETASLALENYKKADLATGGRYDRWWNRTIGNSNLGVGFPGGVTLISPPVTSGLYGYAHQRTNALIWGRTFSVLSGELLTYRSGSNQFFGAYLTIAGNLIRRQYEVTILCEASRSGTLYSGSVTFIDVTFQIPIFAVITLDLNVRATGHFSMTYSMSINACNVPNISASAGITPVAWATASASVSLNIVVARGGATLSATLLNTSVVGTIAAAYNGSNFTLSVKVAITTKALSGSLYVWADVRSCCRWAIPPWYWKRIGSATIWSFNSPAYTYTLIDQAW
jgi:hypothetical protein